MEYRRQEGNKNFLNFPLRSQETVRVGLSAYALISYNEVMKTGESIEQLNYYCDN